MGTVSPAVSPTTKVRSGVALGVKIGIGMFIVLPMLLFGSYLLFLLYWHHVIENKTEVARWAGPIWQEISDEKIEHDGDVTHTRFVSIIDAPLATVQKLVWDVENGHQMVENIKLSKLLESKGNTKLVEMNLQALNLPLQAYTMEFTSTLSRIDPPPLVRSDPPLT
jgi:hypothetical protein